MQGLTVNCHRPDQVVKDFLERASGDRGTCQYPLLRSSEENQAEPLIPSRVSLAQGRGYKSLTVISFIQLMVQLLQLLSSLPHTVQQLPVYSMLCNVGADKSDVPCLYQFHVGLSGSCPDQRVRWQKWTGTYTASPLTAAAPRTTPLYYSPTTPQ